MKSLGEKKQNDKTNLIEDDDDSRSPSPVAPPLPSTPPPHMDPTRATGSGVVAAVMLPTLKCYLSVRTLPSYIIISNIYAYVTSTGHKDSLKMCLFIKL